MREQRTIQELKLCPKCGTSWLYQFTIHDIDHHFGYKVNCRCGYAAKKSVWKATRKEAIEQWNGTTNNS